MNNDTLIYSMLAVGGAIVIIITLLHFLILKPAKEHAQAQEVPPQRAPGIKAKVDPTRLELAKRILTNGDNKHISLLYSDEEIQALQTIVEAFNSTSYAIRYHIEANIKVIASVDGRSSVTIMGINPLSFFNKYMFAALPDLRDFSSGVRAIMPTPEGTGNQMLDLIIWLRQRGSDEVFHVM